ncbi:MAG: response regulator [Deltaproteobacteria bacterium]|nr:response regulator [Deltaproteobacteria bacterium]
MNAKKKILALDDQKPMQNILNFALKKEFDITVVDKARKAIEKLKAEKFDMALLDIALDGDETDGIGVAEQLQALAINVPIVFLTSFSKESLDEEQLARIGRLTNLKFYQIKPITPHELIDKIKQTIG